MSTALNGELTAGQWRNLPLDSLVRFPPTLAISVLAQQLKVHTGYALRREYTDRCVRGQCVATSYFPSPAVAHALSIIRQYIG